MSDDDDDAEVGPAPATNGAARAALAVGVVSLLVPPLGGVALILGGLGVVRASARGGVGKRPAVAGLVVGAFGAFGAGWFAVSALASLGRRPDMGVFGYQMNKCKQVALAVENYEGVVKHLPGESEAAAAAGVPDPASRLGFRASLLPYLEEANLHNRLDFAQAWDGPKNAPATSSRVRNYEDATDGPSTQTRFRTFTGNGAVFDPDPARTVTLATIAAGDGLSNTLLFAESTVTVPWAQNNEMPFTPAGPLPPLGHPVRNVFLAATADGGVRRVRKDVAPAVLRAAITYKGGETAVPLE